ncbi:hypothetical protein [Luteimonas gilva]|nr:hypothetical protein [Luteimonas gilva]
MRVIDYNGTGRWTRLAILARYADYVGRFSVSEPLDLTPKEHVWRDTQWVYPVMDKVIAGIRSGDAACIVIGAEFMEEDSKFTFGRALKSHVARAMRQADLPAAVQARLRKRIVDMLIAGNVPREFREYAKLLRKIGFADYWHKIQAEAPASNKYAMRYVGYLRAVHARSSSVVRPVSHLDEIY